MKHGLLSKAAIIDAGDAKEDPDELTALLEALREDLQPEGAMEDILVDRIANCVWRLARAARAEAGEIRLGADSAGMDNEDSIAERYDVALRKEEMSFVPGVGGGSKRELTKTTLGIARIQHVLDTLREAIAEYGNLSMDQLDEVVNIYGRREGSFTSELIGIAIETGGFVMADGEEQDVQGDDPPNESCRAALVASIDAELARLEKQAELVSERERLGRDATVLSRHLPSDKVLEKILRYETVIDRQMDRALKQLRELQTARRARSTLLGTADNGV